MHRRAARILLILCAALPGAGANGIELPRVFSDGMVLQRGQPIPVWGRCDGCERVVVTFAGTTAEASADGGGRWRVELPAHEAGGAHVMRIDDGVRSKELHDILVGDVWLASGQSNMEWSIAASNDAGAEMDRATDTRIRHFKVPHAWSGEPEWQLAGGEWVESSPAAAGGFSAVAHFFARELRKSTGVPIGIIDSTWGGSRIEAWMDAGALGIDSAEVKSSMRAMIEADELGLAQTRRNLALFPHLPVDAAGWEAAALEDADWVPIGVPGAWEGAGWKGMDGQAWYRTTFMLDEVEAEAGTLLLGVGRIDDSDTTWVNGVQVGQTLMQYDRPRRYTVPGAVLRPGENVVAIRVTDTGGGGGIHGPADELFVQPAGVGARPLGGEWKFRPERVTVASDDGKNQRPTLLYNAMIHPLHPFPLRGVIWYQGEANADDVIQAQQYRNQFRAMIRQWRAQWSEPGLPFLWAQLSSFDSGKDAGQESPWALLREAQTAALSLPSTGQAVTIDIGDPADIHPGNKQEVGRRLALLARHVAYGEDLVHAGPVFTGMRVERDLVRLSFDTGSGALAVRDGGELRGFELAGADRLFHRAEAAVDGDGVSVRSRAVPSPVAVRYAWTDAPVEANLANDAGLPALPFRSDGW